MKTTAIWALVCGMMAVQPALADEVKGMILLRDSDGIVISVLHPVDYYPYLPGLNTGGVYYMMDGHVLDFSESPSVAPTQTAGPTAQVAGTTYQVEQSGNDIWLRDPATGVLYPTKRRIAAAPADGLQVNPNAFAME